MTESKEYLEIQAQCLEKKEIEELFKTIKRINWKRKRDNKPRLSYKVKLG